MRDHWAGRLFGGACILCRGEADGVLCSPCEADLPRLPADLCPRCALPSPDRAVCGRCLARAPQYDATVAALASAFPADVLVQALKFRGELALAPVLARALDGRLAAREVDVILPVPLAPERLSGRGFNQAGELARVLARSTGVRLDVALLRKSRATEPQASLPLEARRGNVRGAFACASRLEGASVAVVDDVMTTGATLDEVAGTLKDAGARSVVNWVVARTLPPG